MTGRKLETAIACAAVAWACGVLVRDLVKGTPPARKKKKKRPAPARRRPGPITVDEFHSVRWEIEREQDIVGRAQQEGSS